jgi:hypothetical protein
MATGCRPAALLHVLPDQPRDLARPEAEATAAFFVGVYLPIGYQMVDGYNDPLKVQHLMVDGYKL